MGEQVYEVDSQHHMLRTYCHNTPDGTGKTLLLINLSARNLKIQMQQLGDVKAQYCLTARRLQSRKVRINGIKARFRKGQFDLEYFAKHSVEYELPGHSINFWLLQ